MTPPQSTRTFTFIAAFFGFLAVALGAFGAHALKAVLKPDDIAIWETGVRYHLTHALAILGVGILTAVLGDSKPLRAAGWLFTVGIVLFSGSLYALSTTHLAVFGPITPLGGLCFLLGWGCLAAAAL